MQLIVLGVIGEYIGDIHAEVKRRPLYVVGELENFPEVPELPPRSAVAERRARERPTSADAPRQFARFLVVGVGNTVLSFVAYRLLLAAGTPYVPAAALAFAVGAVNGYVFNRRWTFAAADTTRSRVLYVSSRGWAPRRRACSSCSSCAARGWGRSGRTCWRSLR